MSFIDRTWTKALSFVSLNEPIPRGAFVQRKRQNNFQSFLVSTAAAFVLLFAACTGAAIDSDSDIELASLISSPAARSSIEKGIVYIGMTESSLRQTFPARDITQVGPGLVDVVDRSDIPGKWTLNFKDGKLSWFVFNSEIRKIGSDEFKKSLDMTRKLIGKYSDALGTPGRLVRGIEDFRDPSVQKHQGYQVLNAVWNTPEGRIIVNFSFIGEDNNYSFLVSLQGS